MPARKCTHCQMVLIGEQGVYIEGKRYCDRLCFMRHKKALLAEQRIQAEKREKEKAQSKLEDYGRLSPTIKW